MFTGIISSIGEVVSVSRRALRRFKIEGDYGVSDIALGNSIACDGICLTVIEYSEGNDDERDSFTCEASGETLSRTTASDWEVGTQLNLERAIRLGDEFGGHIVSGHVDGIVEIIKIDVSDSGHCFHFAPPLSLMPFIASKGSICLNGTSLTVNAVSEDAFTVMLIPHSLAVTNWGLLAVGARVNIEIDMLARYVSRILTFQDTPMVTKGTTNV